MSIREQIEGALKKVVKKFAAKKIFLFGSYANGQPDESSDIDLCFITDIKGRRKIDLIRDIRKEIILLNSSYPLDILVYGEKEFNERAKLKSTLENKIMNEGIRLYE